jgi:hypothetical protein
LKAIGLDAKQSQIGVMAVAFASHDIGIKRHADGSQTFYAAPRQSGDVRQPMGPLI